jgi:hypothetical protein
MLNDTLLFKKLPFSDIAYDSFLYYKEFKYFIRSLTKQDELYFISIADNDDYEVMLNEIYIKKIFETDKKLLDDFIYKNILNFDIEELLSKTNKLFYKSTKYGNIDYDDLIIYDSFKKYLKRYLTLREIYKIYEIDNEEYEEINYKIYLNALISAFKFEENKKELDEFILINNLSDRYEKHLRKQYKIVKLNKKYIGDDYKNIL